MPEGRSFRFIQSGDFHLDRPLSGLAHVPDHLRDLFCDANRRSVKNIFETAILHEVDFLLLTGNLLDVRRSTPKTLFFLLEQFQALEKAGIQVFWAGGGTDPPDRWPSTVAIPENVHRFRPGNPQEISFDRDEEPVCIISGRCNPGREPRVGEFRADPGGLFTIAMAHDDIDLGTLKNSEIDYWAIGGRSTRHKPSSSPSFALYAGSPQGLTSNQTGQRSCTLVEVDATGNIQTEAIVTDVVRWQSELVELQQCQSISDLESVLGNRMQTLVGSKGRRSLLIDWRVIVSGDTNRELLSEKVWDKLTDKLNQEFGNEDEPAWTYELTVESTQAIPEAWYQEQTISGDFLRMSRELQADPSIKIDLASMLKRDVEKDDRIAQAVDLGSSDTRKKILRDSRQMGVQLLRIE